MARLLALFAGLVAGLLVPLALSGPTALLLMPAHLGFSSIVCLGTAADGLAGRPERARRWGFFYLLATFVMVAALEAGARVRGLNLGYWGLPWLAVASWAWFPPLVSAGMGAVGQRRERSLVSRAVARRRTASAPTRSVGHDGGADPLAGRPSGTA